MKSNYPLIKIINKTFFKLINMKNRYIYICDGGSLVTKSCLTLVTPRTIDHQALLSVRFP